MAVPAGPTEKRYTGNGVTTIFSIPFLLLSASDLDVFINGIEVVSGFTITGVGNPTSTITFTTAPANLSSILLNLNVPFERLNDYQENGDFLSSTVNRDFDRIWQALKQLYRFSTRSLTLGFFDVDGAGTYRAKGNKISDLADPVGPQDAVTKNWVSLLIDSVSGVINTTTGIAYDAGTLFDHLRFGVARTVNSIAALRLLSGARNQRAFVLGYYAMGDGGGGVYYVDQADTTTADNGSTVIVGADGARWKLNHNGSVSLKQAGCLGDEVTDDAPKFRALIATGIPEIIVDTVEKGFRLASNVPVPRSITIKGNGVQPYAEGGPYQSKGPGSWLFFDHMGRGISITTAVSSGFIATVYLEKIGTYRKHTAAINASWTPTGFDFDIAATNADVFYKDLMLLNPNKAILHLNGLAGRITIDNVRGQFLSQGIYIENAQDSVRVNNLHDWPFWLADTNITNWTTANKVLFLLHRCDNPLLSNIFTIYTNTGIAIYSNAFGSLSKLKGVNLDFDQTWNWLVIDPAADGVTASFCNVSIFGPLPNVNAQCALIRGTNARINIVNLHTEAVSNGAMVIEGTGNVVKVIGSHVKNWDRLTSGAAIFNVGTGNVLNVPDVVTTEGTGTAMFTGSGVVKYPQGVRAGQATIASGATTVVVTHGLKMTPASNQIQLTMATGISTAKTVFVSAVTATTFTISAEVAPSVAISINWRASIE